jgi:hypothetical protein
MWHASLLNGARPFTPWRPRVKFPLLTLACTLLAASTAAAAPKATFRYTPPTDEERPVIVEATIGPQGSDFAMRLRFDKEPWGDQCKSRCANATIFLDTDGNTTTGLQLGKKIPETGADLAVIVQGARDYRGTSSDAFLRVKVRQFTSASKNVDDTEALADLNHRQDSERVQLEENTVYLLIDATAPTLPSARKVRVIYHPSGGKAIEATVAGMLSGGSSSNVRIFRGGTKKGWGKTKEAGSRPSNDNG